MGSGDSSRSCETSSQDLGFSYYPAENLIEYKWPPDEAGEYYMLQEQVSEYLGVTSFKRKYPDLERRDLSHKEKLYLRELNVITETQCTLGLTALRSDEVIDLMIKEYPAKHAEYSVILQEKERQRITDHYKEYSQMQQQNTQKVEASKVPEYIKKAAKKAAEFNSNLNRERMEERRAYFDLQTHVIQVPQGKYKVLPTERTKVSSYPVALIPGQFQEYYKRYSPDELRYLPLNTALYEPLWILSSLPWTVRGTQMKLKTAQGTRNGKAKAPRTAPLAMHLTGKALLTARRTLSRDDRSPKTKLPLQEKMVPNVLYCPNQFLGTSQRSFQMLYVGSV